MWVISPKDRLNKKKSPKKNHRLTWKILIRFFLIFSLIAILALVGIFIWFAKDLPSPGKLNTLTLAQTTKIYDRTGQHILYEIHGEEKRTEIPFSQMPDNIKYATIALEDQNFYSNHGIEIKGIIRAAIKDVLHMGAAQGGSTITQQLVKLSLLSSQKTLTRKIKEVILAVELEQKFSKDQVLAMYLNKIPYGSNAYGIEAAAKTYFNCHASQLTLDEAALLASLPKAPSYYSPYGNHTKNLEARRKYTLDQMAKLGYITQKQADIAKEINTLAKIKPFANKINAPHFVMYIKEYLEEKYSQQMIKQGGMKIYTTLDWNLQQIAEQAVKDGADKNITRWGATNAALVAIDPKTGQILAMVGSKDYFNTKIDGQVNVALSPRQPGSSFKPFVYLAAFQKGFTPDTQLWDVDTNFSTTDGKTYNPKNYDGKNRGLLKMKNALAMSLNVPAVKTLYLAGVKNSINLAHKLGITTLNQPDRYGLSLVLGGGEVTLLDHTNAYATLANNGIYHPKVSILKVEDKDNHVLEQYKPNDGQKVIQKKYIAMLDYILSNNKLRSPVFGTHSPLYFPNRPVAAKTGTTNAWRDGWTMGYTPSLAVGVWAGNNDNTPMRKGADGEFVAAPIWHAFMEKALQNYNIDQFPDYKPEKTGKKVLDGKLKATQKVKVCKIPDSNDYCLANDNCPSSKQDEKKFTNVHTILYYINKDDPQGEQPQKPSNDPQYKNWEKAIIKYTQKHKNYGKGVVPTKECQEDDFEKYKPSIDIKSPSNNSTINSSTFSIKVRASADYGVQKIKLYINNKEVASESDLSLNYTYDASNDNGSTLNIKATITDDNDNDASDSISVKVDF